MKRNVIDIEDVKTLAPQIKSEKLIKWLFDFLRITDVNKLHSDNYEKRGADFTDALLHDLNITLEIEHEERLHNLPEGTFVTLSNHPFGALDGIINISLFARQRPEYKVMVNQILSYIRAMNDNFITVDPITTPEIKAASLNGIRGAIQHVRNGNPIGFFPAGAVARITSKMRIEDREWQASVIKLVKQFNKPVVPIHFQGRNTLSFYLMRLIDWRLSTFRLPTEVFKKRNKTIRVSIGETIMPEEYAHINDIAELGRFFRDKSYALKKG